MNTAALNPITHPIATEAARIRKQLRDCEAKADAAHLAQCELLATLLRARASNDVEVHTGQAAIMRLTRAQQSIVESTNDLFRAHNELTKVAVVVGLGDEAGSTKPFTDG